MKPFSQILMMGVFCVLAAEAHGTTICAEMAGGGTACCGPNGTTICTPMAGGGVVCN